MVLLKKFVTKLGNYETGYACINHKQIIIIIKKKIIEK